MSPRSEVAGLSMSETFQEIHRLVVVDSRVSGAGRYNWSSVDMLYGHIHGNDSDSGNGDVIVRNRDVEKVEI